MKKFELKNSNVQMPHLFFTDDILLIAKANDQSSTAISNTLSRLLIFQNPKSFSHQTVETQLLMEHAVLWGLGEFLPWRNILASLWNLI